MMKCKLWEEIDDDPLSILINLLTRADAVAKNFDMLPENLTDELPIKLEDNNEEDFRILRSERNRF
jgi:hypothetical protein